MSKSLSVTVLFLTVFMTGCATLHDEQLFTPYKKRPAFGEGQFFDKTVGVKLLVDARPSADKSSTRNVKDFPKRATMGVAEQFTDTFQEIRVPPTLNEDIIMEGTIDRFKVEAGPTMIFSPFDYKIDTHSAITLKFIDNATGHLIAEVKGYGGGWDGGSWGVASEVTSQLNRAFYSTIDQLKEKSAQALATWVDQTDGVVFDLPSAGVTVRPPIVLEAAWVFQNANTLGRRMLGLRLRDRKGIHFYVSLDDGALGVGQHTGPHSPKVPIGSTEENTILTVLERAIVFPRSAKLEPEQVEEIEHRRRIIDMMIDTLKSRSP